MPVPPEDRVEVLGGQSGRDRVGSGWIDLLVVGAHLSGEPLNGQLLGHRGVLVTEVRTAPVYRLYALHTSPPKPGLVRVARGGTRVAGERWRLPAAGFGRFVATVAAPMVIGAVQLDDGTRVPGFLVEPLGLEGARDITSYGGWRAYRLAAATTPLS